MPKLEASPSGDSGNAAGERDVIHSLSDFTGDRNSLQWRPALYPLLHGPDTNSSGHKSELMLNGSGNFHRVYGSGSAASAFQGSVEGTFQFVTNVTRRNSGNMNEAESVENEARGEPPGTSRNRFRPGMQAGDNGDGDMLLPSGASYVTPRRFPSAADQMSPSADNTTGGRLSLATNSLSGGSSPSLMPTRRSTWPRPAPCVEPL